MIDSIEIFDLDVLSKGSFIDHGYNVETIVIRLNPAALNEGIITQHLKYREVYETNAEWEIYKAEKLKKREEWKHKIAKKLNIPSNAGFCITKNVSEIFTVVYIQAKDKPVQQN